MGGSGGGEMGGKGGGNSGGIEGGGVIGDDGGASGAEASDPEESSSAGADRSAVDVEGVEDGTLTV